jgi:molybdopterin molybdotransferase
VSGLLSVVEAQQQLLSSFSPLGSETVPLLNAAGRVLSVSVSASFDVPSFDNSSMDGFAVRAEDVVTAQETRPVELKVIADLPAGGSSLLSIRAGETIRIMTGAPLPSGADAVVPVEDTDFRERDPGTPPPERVKISKPVSPKDNVRDKGQDIHQGEIVLASGQKLRPQDIGLLAMLGNAQVQVYRQAFVAVISTGDELVPVGTGLSNGKVYDSNSFMLVSQLEKYKAKVLRLGILPDREDAIVAGFEQATEAGVDLILSSAGVSVGAYDYVRAILEKRGHLEFWRVNMRPGKPIAFGEYRGIPFIGLPGNPASAFVGFEVFVRPVLLRLSGMVDWSHPSQRVKLLEPVASDGRESYMRAMISNQRGTWVARLTGHQGSGNLRSLVQANALLIVPSGVKSLPVGAEVDTWLLNDG